MTQGVNLKTVLLAPGFEGERCLEYDLVLSDIEACGYRAEFAPIMWYQRPVRRRTQYTTLDDWVADLSHMYEPYDPAETVLAGYSYGAFAALFTAARRPPSELWLFTLSAYLPEDLPYLPSEWLDERGPAMIESFQKADWTGALSAITCKTLLTVGGLEPSLWQRRAQAAHAAIPSSRLRILPGAGHDLGSLPYRIGLVRAITEH